MSKRKIIKIDEDKCNGCGVCIPDCPEGAIKIIDNKARLLSDLFCDGLGACLGHCPQGAITIEEREADKYNEGKVMENIVKQGKNVIRAHLEHLKEHNESGLLKQATDYLKENNIEVPSLACGCPGSRVADFREKAQTAGKKQGSARIESELLHWPVQITLVSPSASFLKDANLLIAADCVPFAYANFHQDLLKGKILLVGCPKLDDAELQREKIGQILKDNRIKSVTYAHMEVPCCFGLSGIIQSAIAASGKNIPFNEVVIGIKGERVK